MKDFLEPIPMKEGDTRVYINGETCKVDFRIISESNYQLVMSHIKSIEACLKMTDEALVAGLTIEKNDPIHKKISELITKI